MEDQIQHIKGLIALLDVDSGKKQVLNDRLMKEGASEGLMAEIKTCLDEMSKKIDDMVPETADIEKAQAEFEAEMADIEQEAKELEKQTNKDLDQIQMDSAREALK